MAAKCIYVRCVSLLPHIRPAELGTGVRALAFRLWFWRRVGAGVVAGVGGVEAPARVGAGVVTFRILIVGVGLQSSACGSSSSVSACRARPTYNMLLDTNAHLENGSTNNGSILENGSIDTNAPPLISVL